MGFFSEMQAAAAEAEGILAEITGMGGDAAGNTLIAGQTVLIVGVYGRPQVDFIPQIAGGYRKRTAIPLTITRAQLTTAPAPNTKLTRIDLSPPITYNVESVDTQDPLVWGLSLINYAA
jgi:hypothetical protein